MRHLEQLSTAEIAAMLEISEPAVKSRLLRDAAPDARTDGRARVNELPVVSTNQDLFSINPSPGPRWPAQSADLRAPITRPRAAMKRESNLLRICERTGVAAGFLLAACLVLTPGFATSTAKSPATRDDRT